MSGRPAVLVDGPDQRLHGVDRRRSQLWAVAIVIMAALAGCTVLLALALDAAGAASGIPPGLRIGLVPLVLGVGLYLLEKERHLARLTRAAVQPLAAAFSGSRAGDREALTGLLPADAFAEEVEAALDRSRFSGEPVAVLVIDIARFGAINARHGHDAGDQVLVEVARRLRSVARTDDILGRVDGDELALLAEGVPDVGVANDLAQRLASAMRPTLRIGDRELHVAVTIGAAVQRGGRSDGPADVLRDARLARHLARRRPARPWEVFDRVG